MNLDDIERRMDGAVTTLNNEFKGLRTGRAAPSLLDPITVEVYGAQTPLNKISTINAPEPRLLTINVFDHRHVKIIEKAILNSGLGLNPQTEGHTIRLRIPEMTQERRKDLVKTAGKYAEQARVAIRNVRRDAMDQLKRMEKNESLSKDEHKRLSDKVQTITDNHVKKVDEILSLKEKEILNF